MTLLADRHVVRAPFRDVDLTEATSRGAVFESCVSAGCRFNASVHVDSAFVACEFRRVNFFGARSGAACPVHRLTTLAA